MLGAVIATLPITYPLSPRHNHELSIAVSPMTSKRKRRAKARRLLNFVSNPAGQTRRSTSIFLISPIAFAGFRPFGQAWAQFMIVWQR